MICFENLDSEQMNGSNELRNIKQTQKRIRVDFGRSIEETLLK